MTLYVIPSSDGHTSYLQKEGFMLAHLWKSVVSAVWLLGIMLLTIQLVQAETDSRLSAPQAGYYRFKLGAVDVVALSSGSFSMDTKLLHASPDKIANILAKSYLTSPVETSVNAYLIVLGDKRILVDTGPGSFFGPALNKMILGMQRAGYQAEEITDVLITHMHTDHCGGLVTDTKRTFTKAMVHVERQEYEYWTSTDNRDKADTDNKAYFDRAIAIFKPYSDDKKIALFDGETTLFEGLSAIPMRGHTPGHSFYQLESQGKKLQFWGDILHVAPVQLYEPSITIDFDIDSTAAAKKRLQVFEDAAKHGYFVAPAHMSFPGIGRISKHRNEYRWHPVLYVNNSKH
jgi:glyoxylase-like metal-dependent hydrolase (beta-lactamase superfamily II)